MNKNYLLGFVLLSLISISLVSATLNVSLSDQGTGVAYLNGTTLSSGDLNVLIYTASSGGSPTYNETFSDAISNGSWNVMLGSGSVNLSLEFGKVYYKDYLIAGENANFDGNDRQAFYSPLGDINGSDLASDFYIDSSGNISTTNYGFFGWLGSLINRITTLFVQDIDASGNINASNYTLNGTTIDDWSDAASISDTQKSGGGIYLYNDSSTIYLNETVLNTTVNFLENDTLADLSCSSDEIAKYNGSLWQCASESASGGIWINDTDWTYINTTLAPDNVSVSDLNVTGDLYVANNSIYIGNARLDLAKYGISTGVLSGGTISINASNSSLLDVTTGTAIIANLSNINDPIIETVSWDAQTIYPNLAGVRSKWIGVNASGDFIFSTAFTALEKRTVVVLGRAWGAGTDAITGKGQYSTPAFGTQKLTEDLVYALGSLNIAGNVFSANGVNLLLNKSLGQSFRFSAAFGSSPTSPNIHDDAEQLGITSYKYHLQGSSTTTTESNIEPDYYDVGGSKTAVTNNKFTVQRIYFFPVSGTVHVTYGQTEYGTLTEATDAAQTEAVILNTDILSGSILRAWIVIEQGTADLSDSAKASIITASNIGAGGGGAGGVSTHSSLSNLEWNVSGHTFSSADTMDIGGYNFTTTGRIGIGTSSPTQALDVNGSVNITGDLWVQGQNMSVPDYVFEPDYNLMFLDEVKSYTEINKHLPDSEIQGSWDNSVQKRQNFLLEKIEEIFLHLFRIDERIDNLEEENDLLKSELCVRDNSYSWC